MKLFVLPFMQHSHQNFNQIISPILLTIDVCINSGCIIFMGRTRTSRSAQFKTSNHILLSVIRKDSCLLHRLPHYLNFGSEVLCFLIYI